jgi:hypothetical protein
VDRQCLHRTKWVLTCISHFACTIVNTVTDATGACELATTIAACPATRCQWYGTPLFLCWGAGRPVPCNRYASLGACAQNHACEFEESSLTCVDCTDPSGKCVTPTAVPAPTDHGTPCAQITDEDQCLDAAEYCVYDYRLGILRVVF